MVVVSTPVPCAKNGFLSDVGKSRLRDTEGLMRMDSAVSDRAWEEAIEYVDTQLTRLGLMTRVLAEEVAVYYGGILNEAYRMLLDADGLFIPEWNSIHLPNRWLTRYLGRRASGSLREIYCHEVAHALAENHWGAVLGNNRFAKAFGNSYRGDRRWAVRSEDYCTDYAMERPMEDFAETFSVWVTKGGKAPQGLSHRLQGKFAFIQQLPSRLTRRGVEVC